MKPAPHLSFPPFRLDAVNERLWRGSQLLVLRPKAFAVLRYLVEHAGQLVTREELLRALWPDAYVSQGVLRGCIHELRQVLGDEAKEPRFIETVARRGYRFIGKISSQRSAVSCQPLETRNLQLATHPVGREEELEQLQGWLEKALAGERQIVFVTGEAGIGKTTVVDAFLQQASAVGELWIGRGQCVEHYGAGEAYLPVLEALGQLCREAGGERLIELLGRYAPTWLVQMPVLIGDAELEALQRKVQGATRERMLREMVEALEVLTAERALVLALEDLPWSDYSTLDLISSVAKRRGPARLLLIGTYRPAEVIVREHPLRAVKQELQMHGQCEELALGFLTQGAVAEYLRARFAGNEVAAGLAQWVYQRTDGNPLFMVNVMDYLVRQGLVAEVEGQWQLREGLKEIEVRVPESLRQMIEKQVEELREEEQRVLEVASVAGVEFSAAAVAAGLGQGGVEVEERCERLVRHNQFLRSEGTEEWPDGTVAARYSFVHSLYQNVLYERLTVGKRVQLHRRIGEMAEKGYGEKVGERAAELAMHFERGRDYGRAVQYLGQAAENAVRQYAYQDAIIHLTKGLELLKTLPDTPERTRQELVLLTSLGPALIATKGYAAPEVEKTYARAQELCQQIGQTPQLFPAVWGLCGFYLLRAELKTAHRLAEQLLSLAQSVQDPALLLSAHDASAVSLIWLGELALARAHAEQGITLYDPQQHPSLAFVYGHDAGVTCLSYTAWALWALGYPKQALKRSQEALTLARELSYPYNLAVALNFTALLHQLRREGETVQGLAEEAMALSTKQGFALWAAFGRMLRGWALSERGEGEEGVAQMQQGWAAFTATGAELTRPYFLALLAEAYGKVGQAEEGLAVLAEALAAAHKSGERFYEAELYRLKGELTLTQSRVQSRESRVKKGLGSRVQSRESRVQSLESEAEKHFLKAIEIAQHQSAKSLELRAVMSLSRLWQKQGKKKEARKRLAEIYSWFTEGFDTADLREAKALLAEMS